MFLKELNICLGIRGCEFNVIVPYNIQILEASYNGPSGAIIDFDHMLSPKTHKPISKRLYEALMGQYQDEITETIQEEN